MGIRACLRCYFFHVCTFHAQLRTLLGHWEVLSIHPNEGYDKSVLVLSVRCQPTCESVSSKNMHPCFIEDKTSHLTIANLGPLQLLCLARNITRNTWHQLNPYKDVGEGAGGWGNLDHTHDYIIIGRRVIKKSNFQKILFARKFELQRKNKEASLLLSNSWIFVW